jgi:hypothetical protein
VRDMNIAHEHGPKREHATEQGQLRISALYARHRDGVPSSSEGGDKRCKTAHRTAGFDTDPEAFVATDYPTGNQDIICDACQLGTHGDDNVLMACEHSSCAHGMHLDCFEPPLVEVPAVQWLCEKCEHDVECFVCEGSDIADKVLARCDGGCDRIALAECWAVPGPLDSSWRCPKCVCLVCGEFSAAASLKCCLIHVGCIDNGYDPAMTRLTRIGDAMAACMLSPARTSTLMMTGRFWSSTLTHPMKIRTKVAGNLIRRRRMPSSSMRCMRATLRLVWRASACYTRAIHPSLYVSMYVSMWPWSLGQKAHVFSPA